MRLSDEQKRVRIIQAAARLFATRPFHEVTLADVAAQSKVGKGTLYVYYKSKEDLYVGLIYEGFAKLVDHLKESRPRPGISCSRHLRVIIDELVRFSFDNPHFFELMRHVGLPTDHPLAERKRAELFDLIENVIRQGIRRGEFRDWNPKLTARFLPSLIRAALLFPPGKLTAAMVTRHIHRLLMTGLSPA